MIITNNIETMKTNILIAIIAGSVIVVGVGAYLVFRQPSSQGPQNQTQQTTTVKKGKLRDMMGQYSFGLDVCNEVGRDFVAGIIDKPVVDTRDFSTQTNTGCEFIVNKSTNDFAAVYVEFSDAETIKKGQQMLGRTIKTDPKIAMDHFIVVQDNGLINEICLIMAKGKYVRVDRTGGSGVTDAQLIELASKLVDKILYE